MRRCATAKGRDGCGPYGFLVAGAGPADPHSRPRPAALRCARFADRSDVRASEVFAWRGANGRYRAASDVSGEHMAGFEAARVTGADSMGSQYCSGRRVACAGYAVHNGCDLRHAAGCCRGRVATLCPPRSPLNGAQESGWSLTQVGAKRSGCELALASD